MYRKSIRERMERDYRVFLLVLAIRTCTPGIRRCGSSFARQHCICLLSQLEQVFVGRFPNGIVNIAVCLSDMEAFLGRFKLRPMRSCLSEMGVRLVLLSQQSRRSNGLDHCLQFLARFRSPHRKLCHLVVRH
jgi:hypothetical protein